MKSNSFCRLRKVILIWEAELQHPLRVRFLRRGICRGRLATQQPFRKRLEGWNLSQLDIEIIADVPWGLGTLSYNHNIIRLGSTLSWRRGC